METIVAAALLWHDYTNRASQTHSADSAYSQITHLPKINHWNNT